MTEKGAQEDVKGEGNSGHRGNPSPRSVTPKLSERLQQITGMSSKISVTGTAKTSSSQASGRGRECGG